MFCFGGMLFCLNELVSLFLPHQRSKSTQERLALIPTVSRSSSGWPGKASLPLFLPSGSLGKKVLQSYSWKVVVNRLGEPGEAQAVPAAGSIYLSGFDISHVVQECLCPWSH